MAKANTPGFLTTSTETTPTSQNEISDITLTTRSPYGSSEENSTAITTTTESIYHNLQNYLICINSDKETFMNSSVSYDAYISIVYNNDTKITYIILSQIRSEDFQLLYFSNPNKINFVNMETIAATTEGEITVPIEHLDCNTAYVFCLMIDNDYTSPFNCPSYYTGICTQKQLSWVKDNCFLIISVTLGGIFLFAILGMFTMYVALWLRPTWLLKSKQLLRPSTNSPRISFVCKDDDKRPNGGLRSSDSKSTVTEYEAYYRHLKKATLRLTESNKYNIPPQEHAPLKPPVECPKSSLRPDTYVYESFDLYEELL
ncbi:uncharacterized protein LOC108602567 isoform X2 [Drosophila busckii]|uniref:uncharacterized protein LOC108602567 isoform X2 n=1 Tax=Drosophila busckii TaxID=30019 RepID=UPI00083F0D8C|nr:uncharacterized protein LOC108602567 isoform X2 [Drosophila busckii]